MTSGIGTATPGQRIAAKQPTRFSGGTRSSIRLRNRSSIQSGTNRPTGIQIPTDRAASGIGMGKGGLRDAAQEPSERHHRAPRGHSPPGRPDEITVGRPKLAPVMAVHVGARIMARASYTSKRHNRRVSRRPPSGGCRDPGRETKRFASARCCERTKIVWPRPLRLKHLQV
jgi:hypothetical protein